MVLEILLILNAVCRYVVLLWKTFLKIYFIILFLLLYNFL